jgi:phthalate transport system substrate-binding protein
MVVLRAVSPADIWAVVVRPDSTLKTPADFKGKKYGVVSLSGTNYGTTFLSFKTEGVDLMRDVKVSTLPPSNLVTALEKGEIDGGTIYEPYLTTAVKNGRVKILFRPGDTYQKRYGEPFLALVISARKEFTDKNPAAAANFISVMEDTLTSLESNLDAAAQAHVECIPDTRLTPAETKEYLLPYAPNVIKTRNDPAFIKSAQNLYDRLLDAKQLQQPVKAADFWVKLQ